MGRVVVITGSTRGIGLALVKHFYDQGDKIILNGRSDESVAYAMRCFTDQERILPFTGDIGKRGIADKIVESVIEKWGRIDIVINNAGMVRDRISYKMTDEEWDEVIDTHLYATFALCRSVVPTMRKQGGGIIINMTSLAGVQGQFGQANYASAKGGIIALTYTLSQELSRFGISVNAVSPAALTDMTKPYVEAAKQNNEKIDYWQIGNPEDVCPVVDYLCSPSGRNVTGNCFSVNGKTFGWYSLPEHHTYTFEGNHSIDFIQLPFGKKINRKDVN